MDAKISSDFWGDPAVEEMTKDQRLAALWAITNSRTTFIGLVEVTAKRFEFESGCPYEALESLPQAHPKGFIKFENGFWIRKFIARQFGTGSSLVRNNFCKPICQALRAVEGLPVFTEVLLEYPELQEPYDGLFFNNPELPLGRSPEGLGKPKSRAEQSSKEQSRADSTQNPEKSSPSTPAGDGENSSSEKKERGGGGHDPLLVRAKRLFWRDGRREMPAAFTLDSAEERAWKKNKGAVQVTSEEDWRLLEWAYAQTQGDAAQYRRTQLSYLLNNWNGELHASRTWAKKAGALGAVARGPAPADVAPEGWEAEAQDLYPGCDTSRGWAALSPDVQNAILENLKKKEGGAE